MPYLLLFNLPKLSKLLIFMSLLSLAVSIAGKQLSCIIFKFHFNG